MKKLTKLIFSCAAVAAVTAAVGTAALAAGVTPAYDAESNSVTLTYESTDAEQTILIVKDGVTNVTNDTPIYYVNQQSGKFTAAIPMGELEDGTYEVRIGGTSGNILTGDFTVGEGPTPGEKVLIGDVNEDTAVDSADATVVLRHGAGLDTLTGKKLFIAKVDSDDVVDSADATCILRYGSELSTGTGKAGQQVEYTE